MYGVGTPPVVIGLTPIGSRSHKKQAGMRTSIPAIFIGFIKEASDEIF